MPFLLALDARALSARATLYDARGVRVASAALPIAATVPRAGWIDCDAEEIWDSQKLAIDKVLAVAGVEPGGIAAIGIANQRDTIVVWNRETSEPVAPAIAPECRRTELFCRDVARSRYSGLVHERTGLPVDPRFAASKLRWILDQKPEARKMARDGALACGTIDSWLIWKLTEGAVHVTDPSNASRTMLMDLADGEWDADLLSLFDVPAPLLPRIASSSAVHGVAVGTLFGAEIPIAGIAGDEQASLFGQCCFRRGLAKNTYGAGCSAAMQAGARRPMPRHKLTIGRAAAYNGDAPHFVVEGGFAAAGSAIDWLREHWGVAPAEWESLAASVPDSGGVTIVPAFEGLGAPHWDACARASISGLSFHTTRGHLARAALEGIAYQTRELIQTLETDSGGARLLELRADGEVAASDLLLQFQADLLGCPVVRQAQTDSAALGAAYLAGLAVGVFRSRSELEQIHRTDRVFEPSISADQRESLAHGWRKAVARVRTA